MILIDTHILLWWVNDDGMLSPAATNTIKTALASNGEVLVSSISAWEIGMLVSKDQLALNMDAEHWLDEVSQINGVRFVPVDNTFSIKSTKLPCDFHKDPADRIIVATARKFGLPLITADEKILEYQHVKAIW